MKMDAVVVGAGLAGLSAAERLAEAGLQVVVLERGDGPGTKNVTGGRIYVDPIREVVDRWEGAPWERAVTREAWTLADGDRHVRIEYGDPGLGGETPQSYTVLRGRLDAWLGDRVAGLGAFVIPEKPVFELLREDGRVAGVRVDGEDIPAHVVLGCDGVLSFVGQAAGLRSVPEPAAVAVGIKEVVGLPAGVIEDRFGLEPGEGAAELFLGTFTGGRMGGGFVYTNRESLSIGVVVGVKDLMASEVAQTAPEILEAFKAHPRVRRLVEGGELLEYSAHLIPESGLSGVGRIVDDGILLAGDAAGFALNMGYTVRGMEFAVASGRMAAEAVIEARERGDVSATGLSGYLRRLRGSFVWRYLEGYREMPRLLENPDLYRRYPREVAETFGRLARLGREAPEPLAQVVWSFLRRNVLNRRDARFWWKARTLGR
ncbi:FAD-dependent oxidoreductase [Deferrisoma palaeochoriense]